MKKFLSLAAGTLLLASCGVELGYPGGATGSGSKGGTVGDGDYIYVTDSKYSGDLNGVSGADGHCNSNDANKPSGAGSFKALIVTPARSVAVGDWPLKANQQYIRGGDRLIIGKTTAGKIFNFPLSVSFGTTGTAVWTGMNTSYTAATSCTNFTDGTVGTQGTFGTANSKSNTAISSGVTPCTTQYSLICVEQ
jgi:hypothetical protein